MLMPYGAVAPGATIHLGVRVHLADHWHTYWINPGDSGMPPRVAWRTPPGLAVGGLQFPVPRRIDTPPFVTFGYEGDIVFPVEVQVPEGAQPGSELTLSGTMRWLICKDICIPRKTELTCTLRVGTETLVAHAQQQARIEEALALVPREHAEWSFSASVDAVAAQLRVRPPADVDAAVLEKSMFFPEARGFIDYQSKPQWRHDGTDHLLMLKRSGEADLGGPVLRGALLVRQDERAPIVLSVAADVNK